MTKWIVVAAWLVATTVGFAQTGSGSLELRFTDGFGMPIGPVIVTLVGKDKVARKITVEASGGMIRLPDGGYEMTASAAGFSTNWQEVYVDGGKTTLIAQGLCIAQLAEPFDFSVFTVKGKVTARGRRKAAEVRGWGVFNGDQFVTSIDRDGQFSARFRCEGEYTLAVVIDGKVSAMQRISLMGNDAPVRIEVK
jgi:hypothetical protein